jgi:predicted negative regulator of RcsB-dependent stress response
VELLSEEEQWESLKRWLKENVPFILGMVAVGLLAVFGWRWWQGHENTDALEASASYQRILATFDSGKLEDALSQVEALRKQHPKSGYVSSADLAAAKVFVLTNDLDKAVQRLERVMNEAVDEQLRPIARLRLARVLATQGQYDKALAALGNEDRGRHQSAYLEARGDVLFAKGDRTAALAAYEAAKKLLPASQAGVSGVGELLDLKINDLRAAAATAPAAAPAVAAPAPASPAKPTEAPAKP